MRARQLRDAILTAGSRLDLLLGRLCALLIAVMVAIVWFGVVSRYILELGITWTEELARYVMIWAALLAVPVGVYRRAHIGVELLFRALPEDLRRGLALLLDLLGLAFFLFLFVYGIGMARSGAQQYATIFGMTMLVPFASVPVSALLAALQTVVAILRDRDLESRAATGGMGQLP